jgi:hypothetical protein
MSTGAALGLARPILHLGTARNEYPSRPMQTTCDERCERRGLRPAQRRIVRAVAEALLSDADESGRPIPPRTSWLDAVLDDFDKMLGAASPDIRRGFLALSVVVETLPPVMIGSLHRMSQLPLAERIIYLQAIEGSRIGLMAALLVAFKIPLTMIAYDQGEALAMTGFDRASLSTRRDGAPVVQPEGTLVRRAAEGGAS